MSFLLTIYYGYRDLMDNKSDPRTTNWPLMSSPFPTIAISLAYAFFVKVLGPKLMENRKPFQLRGILVVYNLIQVIFSTWIFYEVSCQLFLDAIFFFLIILFYLIRLVFLVGLMDTV